MFSSWWRQWQRLKFSLQLGRPAKRGRDRRKARPHLETLEDRLAPAIFLVTNTNDLGDGSLRQAILDANGTSGADRIEFNISGPGPHTISPATPLPAITDPVVIDGYTQPGASPNTLANGNNALLQIVLDGSQAGSLADGLQITAGNSTISGLVIGGFGGSGIVLAGSGGNTLTGNFIGTTVSGTRNAPNLGGGILIDNVPNNTIGGTTPAARNLISGNSFAAGVLIRGSSASGNLVQGNFIGTDLTGTQTLANETGVIIQDAPDNLIGGTATGARNIISGNIFSSTGVEIVGSGATGNRVEGNFIGTDVTGTVAIPNQGGVLIASGASGNIIGGTAPGVRNLISGNFSYGVRIANGSPSNRVEGNFIGTDVTGALDLANMGPGVEIDSAANNTIGGTTAGARNVISGNDGNGIRIVGSTAMNNLVQGNFIGTDSSGTLFLGNGGSGVLIDGAPDNLIGGTAAGARNIISGNGFSGVTLLNHTALSATGNRVEGNFIGTDVNGTSALGNGFDGVNISFLIGFSDPTPSGNTIGGSTAAARNLISGNDRFGVVINGAFGGAADNRIQGNFIGTDVTGTLGLGNGDDGVVISSLGGTNGSATGNVVVGNVISGNGEDGVTIEGDGASRNRIEGNFIGTDAFGVQDLGNAGNGVVVNFGAFANIVGGTTAGTRNVISGNDANGVLISDLNQTGNLVQGNFIGTDVTGTAALGNDFDGIRIENSPNNTVGGTDSAARNIISGNLGVGVHLIGSSSTNNQVQSNFIGTDATGTGELGNHGAGVRILNAPDNIIGGIISKGVFPGGNRIAFNDGAGVAVEGNGSTGNLIVTNAIFQNSRQDIFVGIDLGADGRTANDLGDNDIGPNDLQNFPVLTSATITGGTIEIRGTLNSKPDSTFLIEFFSNSFVPRNEGESPLDFLFVTTDSTGNASFTLTTTAPAVGPFFTATATDLANNNTSEFSDFVEAPPTVTFTTAAQNTPESASTVLLTLQLSHASAADVTIPFSVAGTAQSPADYTLSPSPVVIPGNSGITTATITVSVVNDSLDEDDETVIVTLGTPTNAVLGAITQHTLTILDDDPEPSLSISDVTVTEGDSGQVQAVFTVSLSAPSGRSITVNYATQDGTAQAGTDYSAVTASLFFGAGQTSQTITVPVLGDTLDEDDETFFVNLSNPFRAILADGQGQGTIIDNDPEPSLTIGEVTVTEGDSSAVQAVFTVSLDAPSGRTVTVAFATENGTAQAGSDYNATSGTLTFSAGQTSQTITVPILGN
ncbi:MAG TPA: Calx-beta domain-containing protein, partial [Gemmataceae bacterium]|nr:Calx-beta domain-containing protein [Gemmataceae bacterium]